MPFRSRPRKLKMCTHKQLALAMARQTKITYELLDHWISLGRGFGWGESYKSWMRLDRRNASPVSTQVRHEVPPFVRKGHYFCQSEFLIALAVSWMGGSSREQVPMFPWTSTHPMLELHKELDLRLAFVEGMLDICHRLGIDHGVFVGTTIPYVWTIDLLCIGPYHTVDHPQFAGVSVKPVEADRFLDLDPICREAEKLAAEHQWHLSANLRYRITDRTAYPGPFLANLQALKSAALQPAEEADRRVLNDFLQKRGPDLQSMSAAEWCSVLRADFGAREVLAWQLAKYCIWHQLVDWDLSKPLEFERLPPAGGRVLRAHLARDLFGEASS
jgi:hypothetical protein